MVLCSFQCRGVLLIWHIVGQGPAVLAAGAEWVVCFLCVFSSCLSYLSFSDALSLWWRLDILKYCGLGHYCGRPRSTVYIRVVLNTHLSCWVRELDLTLPRVVTLISSDYWHDNRGNYRQLAPLKNSPQDKSREGQTSDIKAFCAITRAPKDV